MATRRRTAMTLREFSQRLDAILDTADIECGDTWNALLGLNEDAYNAAHMEGNEDEA